MASQSLLLISIWKNSDSSLLNRHFAYTNKPERSLPRSCPITHLWRRKRTNDSARRVVVERKTLSDKPRLCSPLWPTPIWREREKEREIDYYSPFFFFLCFSLIRISNWEKFSLFLFHFALFFYKDAIILARRRIEEREKGGLVDKNETKEKARMMI